MKAKIVLSLMVALAFLLSVKAVWAQVTPFSSTNFSGSITSGTSGSFQLIQGQTNNRQGCMVQNNGSHTMYVYFGPIANATTAGAVALGPAANGNGGQSVNCTVNGRGVMLDAVSISGTSADSFTAYFQ